MKTIYLCGPINGCKDSECLYWRDFVKSWGFNTLDPMRRDYRDKENENFKEIVELDKIDIVNSDIVLVNYIRPSVGTSMEILYAFERGKLIIIISDENLIISPWLKYHSQFIVNSFSEAKTLIHSLC